MTTESATAELTSVQLAHFDSFGFVEERRKFRPGVLDTGSLVSGEDNQFQGVVWHGGGSGLGVIGKPKTNCPQCSR